MTDPRTVTTPAYPHLRPDQAATAVARMFSRPTGPERALATALQDHITRQDVLASKDVAVRLARTGGVHVVYCVLQLSPVDRAVAVATPAGTVDVFTLIDGPTPAARHRHTRAEQRRRTEARHRDESPLEREARLELEAEEEMERRAEEPDEHYDNHLTRGDIEPHHYGYGV